MKSNERVANYCRCCKHLDMDNEKGPWCTLLDQLSRISTRECSMKKLREFLPLEF